MSCIGRAPLAQLEHVLPVEEAKKCLGNQLDEHNMPHCAFDASGIRDIF